MNNQDPIADMLTRIRNANRVGRRMVLVPKSKICTGIAQVLRDEGYIEEYDVLDDGKQGTIRVKLKYSMSGDKVIHDLDRASKPGRRIYRKVEDLPKVLNGMEIEGVVNGYKKSLEVQGVGYKAEQKGKNIVLAVGYANTISVPIPAGVNVALEGNRIHVTGPDKQLVGQFASDLRRVRKPEPYKGKGIRYEGEYVKIKPGKAVTGTGAK